MHFVTRMPFHRYLVYTIDMIDVIWDGCKEHQIYTLGGYSLVQSFYKQKRSQPFPSSGASFPFSPNFSWFSLFLWLISPNLFPSGGQTAPCPLLLRPCLQDVYKSITEPLGFRLCTHHVWITEIRFLKVMIEGIIG